jgi:Palmitoyl protein thioesterase
MLLGVLFKFVAYYVLCCASLSRSVKGSSWTGPPKNDLYVRPLVLWHGLGDSASSPGMLEFMELIRGVHPGIFIHSVYIDEDNAKDQRAGFVSPLYYLIVAYP